MYSPNGTSWRFGALATIPRSARTSTELFSNFPEGERVSPPTTRSTRSRAASSASSAAHFPSASNW